MSHISDVSVPLARSKGLLIEQVGDETVVLDTETREAHCLSPLAAAVFAGADGRTRVEGIAELVSSDEPVSAEQVYAALAQLDERGLLDRPALPADPPRGISRRTLVRRTAVATATVSAAPMITSIVTPAFAQGTPDARCPGSLCASQSAGDDFCACNNTCPCVEAGTCEPDDVQACAQVAETPPRLDSCECLNCDQLTDAGRPDLCPPEPFTQCPPGSSPQNPGPGGCIDDSKFLDGACLRLGGDSTEPCPEP
jgi:hypothetical protein